MGFVAGSNRTKRTMKTWTRYLFTLETQAELEKVPANTVSRAAQDAGVTYAEPLIVGLDCLLRYAQCYQKRFEAKLATDYVLGPEFLAALKGFRGLLNGDGAVAMLMGLSRDSKDNGACEAIFWRAMEASGFTEKDI